MEDVLRNEAIQMMKQGRPPGMVHQHLMWRGLDGLRASAIVDDLLRLKQQAEERDPKRLREEAIWMLFNGRTLDHVVDHFVQRGVDATSARAEAERIELQAREMRPCDRCRRPAVAKDLYFDSAGAQICKGCRSGDDINIAQHRVFANTLESAGVPPWVLQASGALQAPNRGAAQQAPFCAHCKVQSGIHVAHLHPAHRAQVSPGFAFACGQCLRGIG